MNELQYSRSLLTVIIKRQNKKKVPLTWAAGYVHNSLKLHMHHLQQLNFQGNE